MNLQPVFYGWCALKSKLATFSWESCHCFCSFVTGLIQLWRSESGFAKKKNYIKNHQIQMSANDQSMCLCTGTGLTTLWSVQSKLFKKLPKKNTQNHGFTTPMQRKIGWREP